MKSKYRPNVSDENLVPEFRSDIAVTYMPNFKTYYQKEKEKMSHLYFYTDFCCNNNILDRLD